MQPYHVHRSRFVRPGARWLAAVSSWTIAAGAPRPAAAQAGPPAGAAHADRHDARDAARPTFAAFIRGNLDAVADIAGLPPLGRATTWPAGAREVRLHLGFGIVLPDRTLRLRAGADGVHGWYGHSWRQESPRYELLVAPGTDPAAARRAADAEDRAQEAERLRRARTHWGCRRVARSGVFAGCAVALPGRSWAELLAGFDRLGMARLAEKPEDFGVDGTTLVVEVRDAAGYRVHSYWQPAAGTPEGRVAAALDALSPPRPPTR